MPTDFEDASLSEVKWSSWPGRTSIYHSVFFLSSPFSNFLPGVSGLPSFLYAFLFQSYLPFFHDKMFLRSSFRLVLTPLSLWSFYIRVYLIRCVPEAHVILHTFCDVVYQMHGSESEWEFLSSEKIVSGVPWENKGFVLDLSDWNVRIDENCERRSEETDSILFPVLQFAKRSRRSLRNRIIEHFRFEGFTIKSTFTYSYSLALGNKVWFFRDNRTVFRETLPFSGLGPERITA